MRKLLIGLFVVMAVLIAAILIVPGLVPSDVYKSKIEEQVSGSLGRGVSIAGDVNVSVFPTIKAKAGSVTIANAPGFTGDPLASMKTLEANVKLFPLLKKQVEITSFTLVDPKISLQKKKDGSVNWAFGEPEKSADIKPQDKGPFARDGRYADMQISLGTFTLQNGEVIYNDAQSGKTTSLTSVDMKMTMPGMDKPFSADGDLIYNGTPFDAQISLDTPRAFLSGAAAPFKAKLDSDLISLNADGRFTPSSAITFEADFSSDIPSVSKLDAALGLENPYVALTETASLSGALAFDGITLTAKNANASLASDLISTDFKGDFAAGPSPNAAGDLKLNVKDLAKLTNALQIQLPQVGILKTIDLAASLDTDGAVTNARNIDFKAKGDGLDIVYTGEAAFDQLLKLGGEFNVQTPSAQALLNRLGFGQAPGVGALGNVSVKGKAAGPITALRLTGLDANTKSDLLSASYNGALTMGETLSMQGTFAADAPSVKSLAANANLPLPYADAMGRLNVKGGISGAANAMTISGLEAALTDGMLNVRFAGKAQTGESVKYDGTVDVDIPSVRNLANVGGIELTPSAPGAGEIYGPFSVSGNASGTLQSAKFDSAKLRLDDLSGTGAFAANMSASKPVLSGTLDMAGLDLRPYMAAMDAQKPEGKIQPWSEKDLNLSMLNLFDGKFTLNTPSIIMSRMKMGQSTIQADINDGVLTADIPNVSLYGGKGDLDLTVNARTDVPQIAMDFTLNNLDANSFLGAAAGFTQLSGNTGTTMKIRGQGNSQAEIMRSLSGSGKFELAQGTVKGVDIGQFVSGLDTAFSQRALPAGIGPSYTTPFSQLGGLFSIENGVVTMGDFALKGNNVLAEGGGKLDLGNQKIDFSLRPRLTEGSGLAAFGIPIKFQGGFGSVKAGLDTDLLGQIIAAKAKARVQSELTDRVGGELGGILGGVLGPQNRQSQAPQSGQQSGPSPEQQQPANPKPQTPEQAIGGILGGILGPQTPAPAQPSPEEQKQDEDKDKEKDKTQDDPLNNALKDLFGGGN